MARWRLGLVLIGAALVLCTAQGRAFQPTDDAKVFEVSLREVPPIMATEQLAGTKDVTDAMTTRYGGTWRVWTWNALSDSPQYIYGSGIDLANHPLVTDDAAKTVAANFVASNADLLRADPAALEVALVARGAGKVAVHYGQRYQGIPVEGGRVSAIFSEAGRLFVFGSTFFRNIDVSPQPALSGADATARARADLPFNPATDRVLAEPELVVLPVPADEGGVAYHLTWKLVVGTAEPYGAWVTHVDAHTGEIVQRVNDVHAAYSGDVTGSVDTGNGYCTNNPQTLPLSDMAITVSGLGTVNTNAAGQFSIAGTGGNRTATATFDGPLVDVNDVQFPAASFSGTIQENVPLAINWTDATPSRRTERDVFYWINKANAYIKSIDPTWSIPKHTSSVNVNSSCNANWTTWHMNFFREGGNPVCANTGIIIDVVAHEYGHGIQHSLIGSQGGQGLGEGNGDCNGTFNIDDSVIGRGFYLNTCTSGIRDCENNLVYPGNVVGQPIHSAGRVICGFNWDTRQALEASMGPAAGKAHCATLWHFSRKLLIPTVQPDQVLGYFVIDDDDADLTNGTPNYDQICEGATNHGFECPEILVGVIITHTPLPSTLDHQNDYVVSADIISTNSTVDIADLFYRIDGGAFTEVNMALQGGSTYTASIPAQAQDASIEYYIYGHDALGNERTSPATAPATLHQFYVATVIDNLEANTGWTVGAPGDNATTGVWVRVDPVGTSAQPEDDHTPAPGVLCFVTGNGVVGGGVGDNDVDNGTTTLLSPVFNLSQATQSCIVSYWRWYSNNQGATPNTDFWVVDISNDGGSTWQNVENVNPPDALQNTWVRVDVDVLAMFGIPNQVKLRFVASDLGSGSVVEAAVDDLVALTTTGSAGVEGPVASAPVRFSVGPSQPNPFNPRTTLTYTLPEATQVTVTVFDATGRAVRQLAQGPEIAGEHAITWDGRDGNGATVSSGVYHIRVEAAGQAGTRKIVLLK